MITVLGSANLDQIATLQRLPAPGETVTAPSFATAPGGKGANQALAARRAGGEVRFVGAVGDDAFAAPALALLRAAGVDLSGVRTVEGPTGVALILVDAQGENVIAVAPGANGRLTETDAEAALAAIPAATILMLQGEIPAAANRKAMELARARGVTTVFNTAPFDPATVEMADLASVVVANRTEFAQLSGAGAADLAAAMQDRARRRGQVVVVTAGAEGAWACDGGDVLHAPAAAVHAIDTVGAGDTFCGYLAAGLDPGADLAAALARAAVAASLACRTAGAQPAIPAAADVDAFLAATAGRALT